MGDVDEMSPNLPELPVSVPKPPEVGDDVEGRPVGTGDLGLEVFETALLAKRLFPFRIVGPEPAEQSLALGFFGGAVPEDLGEGAVAGQDHSVGVGDEVARHVVLEVVPVPLLTASEGLFGGEALGDVGDGVHRSHDLSAGVPQGAGVDLDMDPSVLPCEEGGAVVRRATLEQLLPPGPVRGPGLFGGQDLVGLLPDDLFGPEARELGHPLVDVQHGSLCSREHQPLSQRFHHRAEPGLALGKRLLRSPTIRDVPDVDRDPTTRRMDVDLQRLPGPLHVVDEVHGILGGYGLAEVAGNRRVGDLRHGLLQAPTLERLGGAPHEGEPGPGRGIHVDDPEDVVEEDEAVVHALQRPARELTGLVPAAPLPPLPPSLEEERHELRGGLQDRPVGRGPASRAVAGVEQGDRLPFEKDRRHEAAAGPDGGSREHPLEQGRVFRKGSSGGSPGPLPGEHFEPVSRRAGLEHGQEDVAHEPYDVTENRIEGVAGVGGGQRSTRGQDHGAAEEGQGVLAPMELRSPVSHRHQHTPVRRGLAPLALEPSLASPVHGAQPEEPVPLPHRQLVQHLVPPAAVHRLRRQLEQLGDRAVPGPHASVGPQHHRPAVHGCRGQGILGARGPAHLSTGCAGGQDPDGHEGHGEQSCDTEKEERIHAGRFGELTFRNNLTTLRRAR